MGKKGRGSAERVGGEREKDWVCTAVRRNATREYEGIRGILHFFLSNQILLKQSHRNRLWILLLETFVFFHGTLTALCQPGSAAWQIFSFGFAILFFLNQLYDLVKPSFKVVATGFSVLAAAAAYGFHDDLAYYRMTFIPVAQYASLFLCLGLGMMTAAVVTRWSSARWRKLVVAAMYVGVGALLTIGMAVVLAGSLKVYDDY